MKKLFEIYKETMLSPRDVFDKAIIKTIPRSGTISWTKKNFSKIVDMTGKEAYSIFLAEQEKAGKRTILEYFGIYFLLFCCFLLFYLLE